MTDDRHAYRTAAALRTALEDRLRRQAHDSGVPLDRLRKEVAHQRLLARLVVLAPPGSWALKGGQALLARLDAAARATKDADATWRGSLHEFTDVLADATETDLGDGFSFEVSAPRPLTAETDEGGLRFPVLALLDDREFERLQLDVNALPGDDRPLEQLALRDLLGFADISPPTVPVIPVAQHLAEKLHAYARDYGDEPSTRPRDLYDMLVIARSLPLPHLRALYEACRSTFELRQTDWPPALLPAPSTWATAWSAFVRDHDIPWTDLAAASDALRELWDPVLTLQPPPAATWSAHRWHWHTSRHSTVKSRRPDRRQHGWNACHAQLQGHAEVPATRGPRHLSGLGTPRIAAASTPLVACPHSRANLCSAPPRAIRSPDTAP